MKYAHLNGCLWHPWTINAAASQGQLECLKYAISHGSPQCHAAMFYAAQGGHLECLKYLFVNGGSLCEHTFAATAEGHLDCLRFAHENGAKWTANVTNAASKGHLQCLKFAHEHNAPWTRSTMEITADGHLDCLKYAHTHGCNWTRTGTEAKVAARNGHFDCLKYVLDNGALLPNDYITLIFDWHYTCPGYDYNSLIPHQGLFETIDGRFNQCGHLKCLSYMIDKDTQVTVDSFRDAVYKRLVAMAMRRSLSASIIQRSWKRMKLEQKRHAVSVIENAYITWACRPGHGIWYVRHLESFEAWSWSQVKNA